VTDRDLGEQLAGWGKVARLETRGRVTGRPIVVAVGFAERPRGALVVAATSPDADWALNLLAEPRCRILDGAPPGGYSAQELEGSERSAAVRDLILKYGTPSERLGVGPAFLLAPDRLTGG
jgi:deazaflavin-dependent oxidoreductase (nitroreductase family)